MSSYTIDWKKLFTEGAVIVVSILLAFAIDAWWDEREQGNDADDQVSRVLAELNANAKVASGQVKRLDKAIISAKAFLDLLGPEPPATGIDTIASLLERIYSVPTISFERGASNDFLSSGRLTGGGWTEIRIELANTLTDASTAERASVELRGMREVIRERLDDHISGLDLVRAHKLMADYEPSRFESDTAGLLSDMRFESLLATYAIRMEINRSYYKDLFQRLNQLIADIEALAAEH
jgi:hypothetical protein